MNPEAMIKPIILNCDQRPEPGCSVCNAPSTRFFLSVNGCDYRRCDRCMATLLDPAQWLSPEMEYAHYLGHKNNPADKGYRRFLSKLADPLLARLPPAQKGLDYGCGPGSALPHLLSEAGHRVSRFDPFFSPHPVVLERRYDFITCTETIEHFQRPAEEFARFDRMLRPGGWLAIMTCFQTDDTLFSDWHYRREPTHVVFYRDATLRRIARTFGWSCEIPAKDVALMQTPTTRS